jgi:hypothetical protein
LSCPGDFAPKYNVREPSVLYFEFLVLRAQREAVQRVGMEEVLLIMSVSDQKPLTGGSCPFGNATV